MDHDRLCRWDETSGSSEGVSKYPCDCDVIARVREDERACTLRDAVEAVKEYRNYNLGHDFQTCSDRDHSCYLFAEAVAAIESLVQ